MTGKTPTLVEVAVGNLTADGMKPIKATITASRVLANTWALAYAAHELNLGRWPTQVEYAAYWKMPERTAQREWALFRQAFPGEESPDRLARHIAAELGKRIAQRETTAAAALTLPAPGALALA